MAADRDDGGAIVDNRREIGPAADVDDARLVETMTTSSRKVRMPARTRATSPSSVIGRAPLLGSAPRGRAYGRSPAFLSITKGGTITDRRLPDRSVADIVKRRAAAAGVDGDFAAHSLRAGFATEAFSNTVQELSVMRHGRWKSSTSMRGYIREGSLWGDNAAAKLGL